MDSLSPELIGTQCRFPISNGGPRDNSRGSIEPEPSSDSLNRYRTSLYDQPLPLRVPPPPPPIFEDSNESLTDSRYNSIGSISLLSADALDLQIGESGINFRDVNDSPGATAKQNNRFASFISQAKLVLPHVGLVLLSCCYTILGAVTFYFIEHPNEINKKERGVNEILRTKLLIAQHLWNLSQMHNTTEEYWKVAINDELDDFLKVLFDAYSKNFVTAKDVYSNETGAMWTFPASLFFSATLITTIGYGHLVPHTTTGRIMCVLFGLFGIPLILVTVADMAKFLSRAVVSFYIHSTRCIAWTRRRILSLVVRCARRIATRKSVLPVGSAAANGDATRQDDSPTEQKPVDDVLDIDELRDMEDGDDESKVSVPVTFILAVLLGYTCFGAMLLKTWEDWTFLDSFYYCFITVTTIGFGDIIPKNRSFMLITLFYIISGLVVTTMCIDLVGSQYIRKVHYFGQEIRRARFALAAVGDKVVHIGHVIRYVAFLQKRYGLTEEQLERFSNIPDAYLIECLLSGKKLPAHIRDFLLKPYVPDDLHLIKWIDQRRSESWASNKMLADIDSVDEATAELAEDPHGPTKAMKEYYEYCNFGRIVPPDSQFSIMSQSSTLAKF